jgi:hypothetical protein
MTFLALTPLQATLLAVFTAGSIIALYFLKLRHRRVFLSSSMVWRRVLDEKIAFSFWERIRKIISILLAVTIGLLIALSIARPQIEWLTGKTQRIVVVLDTSPSMNTRTADGKTRWQQATEKARALIDSAGIAEFRIADTSGQTAFPFTDDRAEARKLIDQISPEGTELRFPNVDSRDSAVYFFSDGVGISDVPSFVNRVSVFEPATNAAITAFEVRPVPANALAYEAYLEIQNHGPAAEVALTISGTDKDRITRNLRLGREEKFKEAFDLSAFQGGSVQASIRAKDDALAVDDVAYAYLPVQRKTRTLLVSRGNHYLETLLTQDRHVELLKVDPRNYREVADVDVYVFDRFAPPTAPSKPALILGAPAADWLRKPQGVVQKPEITTWADNHPIMQYVSVHDISIERAVRIDPANLTVVAASDQTPLIVASEKPRWVMLTFDLDSSDFPLQAGFPVFIENVLGWFSGEQLALRRPLGNVEVPLANAQIVTADGKTIPSEQQLGNTVFHASQPGLYTAVQGTNRAHVAVSLVNPNLSNVNASSFRAGAPVAPPRGWLGRELWFYMLLAAIALISLEWFTYHRRITL